MKCGKKMLILVGILIIALIFVLCKGTGSSGFGNIEDIIDNTFSNEKETYDVPSTVNEGDFSNGSFYPESLQYNCNNVDSRVIPSGNLPGSTILLTDSERRELLTRFIDNGPEL